ncbi:hypothetical protein DM15PD_10670 [Aristophania vespae]|nr:hypothetical protein DM15PD_10670 [Aristophania vespae]
MSEPVYLTAIIEVAPQHADQADRAMQDCIAHSRKEKACQRYFIYRDLEKPGRFVANEIWASSEGLDAHSASPHFQALIATLKTLSAKIEIMKVSPIEPQA